MSKIDFVVTWVDGQDPIWLEERAKFDSNIDLKKDINDVSRYRDLDFFKYWFRAVEKYAPWVNKIFFVTYGHLPKWLDTSNPKLVVVKHTDFIPQEYLPTYNSNVIELNLHRISNLGEQFVLFSDDVFLNNYVEESDFFVEGLPKDFGIYKPILPDGDFAHTLVNNTMIINKYFEEKETFRRNRWKFFNKSYSKYNLHNVFSLFYKGIIGYHNAHVSLSHLKSTFNTVWDKEFDRLHQVCLHKFRTKDEISHWLMSNWNIESNLFVPQQLSFGKTYPMEDLVSIEKDLKNHHSKVICINDSSDVKDFVSSSEYICRLFENALPEKSSFEK
ncbi:capsular biosynthesis protein [Streptococcus suis]|nr:capsular biosynthesis protein [Streptococcus suis]NQJ77410.1 capsular biosynthesis protein [Streptococcus suis]